MTGFDALYWNDHVWIAIAVISAMLVVVSSFADRRRNRRVNFEAVGFMPWTAITVFSVLAMVIAVALAIKGA